MTAATFCGVLQLSVALCASLWSRTLVPHLSCGPYRHTKVRYLVNYAMGDGGQQLMRRPVTKNALVAIFLDKMRGGRERE
jgi:hypothetical protein